MNSCGLIFNAFDVLLSIKTSNFLKTSMMAVFTSMCANFFPGQVLPPTPKGIKTQRSEKAFTPPCSASNLSGIKSSGFGKNSKKYRQNIEILCL